jgi:hypothetical protein
MAEAAAGTEVVARCHCGNVTIRLPRRPDYVNECNCSLCQKTGFRGVYFRRDEVEIAGVFDSYVRSDIREPMIRNMRCRTCGIATHWELLDGSPNERMGINGRLFDDGVLDGVEVRQVDGRSWD